MQAVVLVIGEGISALGARIPPGLLAYGDHQLLAIAPHGAGDPDPELEIVHTCQTERLLEEARGIWSAGRGELPASCRDRADAVARGLEVERAATVLTLRLELASDELAGLVMCAMGVAPP